MSVIDTPNIKAPKDAKNVLLHTCCAPCSVAIIEAMIKSDITPIIFFYNPNIYPKEEYEKRKEEIIRYAYELELTFIDADYNHEKWVKKVEHLKNEPERGGRCELCFEVRLEATANYAKEFEMEVFATTLASSRWKDLVQINEVGHKAASQYGLQFWDANWRKNGLAERQSVLVKEYDFYRQKYCGCEFSMKTK